MPKLLVAASLALVGCLPAYDNGKPVVMDLAGLDLTMPPGEDLAGSDLSGCQGSGKFVNGSLFSLETGGKPSGLTVHLEGYVNSPQFSSMPSDPVGNFKLEIPDCSLGQPLYFVIDGMTGGMTAETTWIAPRVPMTGTGGLNVNTILHPYLNEDNNMGIRGAIEKALKDHGDIMMSQSLATDFVWMYGWLPDVTHVGQAIPVTGAVLQITVPGGDGGMTVLDNTNCKPDQQCCFYYAYDFGDYVNTMPPSFIDFAATSTFEGWVAVVCPGSETGDITIDQVTPLANLHDYKNSQLPKVNFPTITAPRMTGVGVFLDWQN
jgi:hypothetical protein